MSAVLKKCIYKIIWIVRGLRLVYKCVFIALWSTKMMWAMWLTVSELWEFTVRASYIVFLFVKTENYNFIKEIKYVFRAFIAWWKPRRTFGRIREQIGENLITCSRFFTHFAEVFSRLWRHGHWHVEIYIALLVWSDFGANETSGQLTNHQRACVEITILNWQWRLAKVETMLIFQSVENHF